MVKHKAFLLFSIGIALFINKCSDIHSVSNEHNTVKNDLTVSRATDYPLVMCNDRDHSRNLFLWNHEGWTCILRGRTPDTETRDVAMTSWHNNNYIYRVSNLARTGGYAIYKSLDNGSSWIDLLGAGVRITGYKKNRMMLVNNTGRLIEYDPTGIHPWVKWDTNIIDVSTGTGSYGDIVYAVTREAASDGKGFKVAVYKNRTRLQTIDVGAVRIGGSYQDTEFWIINDKNNLYYCYFGSKGFTKIKKKVNGKNNNAIDVDSESWYVYVVSNEKRNGGYRIYRSDYEGKKWDYLEGGGVAIGGRNYMP